MDARQRQAMRRPSQRARLIERRVPTLQAQAAARKEQARAPKSYSPWRSSWRAVLVFELFMLLLLLIMARGQFEIAWVTLSNRPAQATVTALNCTRGRYTFSDVTLRFSDASGAARTVTHANDTMSCFDQYHVGETVPIRYSTFNSGALLTQAELDDLPVALFFYALIDALALGAPILVLRYPTALAAIARWLPQRKTAQRTRYGQDIDA